ncbi:MAG TPA: type II toxin-antitoxin system RelE/ParE family toxin [Rhizomicrobium sp.]
MKRIAIRPQARIELLEAADWYEARSEDLRAAFLRAFDATIANVVRHPLGYQVVFGAVRRAMLRRFPYAIIYRVDEGEIVVVACIHGARDPVEWRNRV